jgi:hypothetical protein
MKLHYQKGIEGYLTVKRTKENDRDHSVTIKDVANGPLLNKRKKYQ